MAQLQPTGPNRTRRTAAGAKRRFAPHSARATGATRSRIGLSGQMHGANERHQPIRPSIIWCDQRSQAEPTGLLNGRNFKEITCTALTGFTVPKLLWCETTHTRRMRMLRSQKTTCLQLRYPRRGPVRPAPCCWMCRTEMVGGSWTLGLIHPSCPGGGIGRGRRESAEAPKVLNRAQPWSEAAEIRRLGAWATVSWSPASSAPRSGAAASSLPTRMSLILILRAGSILFAMPCPNGGM